MTSPRWLLSVVVVAATLCFAAACADQTITLRYRPDSQIAPLPGLQPITIFKLSDRRGDEGDRDPYRVGGLYGGYGNRAAKVLATTPFPTVLLDALSLGFTARGVEVVRDEREFVPQVSLSTPFALAGEIRNFSAETRYTNSAHVSGIVRLLDRQGAMLVEKEISARAQGGPSFANAPLENLMNEALQGFVRKVVTDEDIAARLIRSRQSLESRLKELDDLKAAGKITEEEYIALRRKVIDSHK